MVVRVTSVTVFFEFRVQREILKRVFAAIFRILQARKDSDGLWNVKMSGIRLFLYSGIVHFTRCNP